MSNRVGKSRSAIANYLRLLKLDPIIQTGMRDNFISMGHGRALITVESLEEQLDIYQKILSESLSVRETEALVKGTKDSPLPRKQKASTSLPNHVESSIQELSGRLNTKVTATTNSKGKGKLSIAFSSKEDLERITKLIHG
jgi:ParB family chromosome partitioning protein